MEYIGKSIKNESEKHSINANIYNSPYNQYNQEVLNTSSAFYVFKPDLTMIILEGRLLFSKWYEFQTLQSEDSNKLSLVQNIYEMIISLIERIHANSTTTIILNNFKVPYYTPMGILDNKQQYGLKSMINLLNSKLEEWAYYKDYAYVFDYNGLCAQFGYYKSEDRKMNYLAKSYTSFSFMDYMSKEYMRYIFPMKSKNRKCLVLDLDNTLWGGIAGEDGISGIKLDICGIGRSFYDFQLEILNLYYKGIILAVNSKNNIEDALIIIEDHPFMLLRKKFFSVLKINWQDKATNLKAIAKELNLGIDSLVFFDDSPVERKYVELILPEVKVVDVPRDVSKYTQVLQEVFEFEILKMTDEDIRRNEMYAADRQRIESQQQINNLEEYLSELDTKIFVEYANDFTKYRIVQLLQKTNQFNMTTKRYDISDVEHMINSDKHLLFTCKLMDKYGDSGLVGVCIIEMEDAHARIDSFLLSCRAMGRKIEYAFLNTVIGILKARGIETLCSLYIRTKKNTVCADFYAQSGFLKETSDDQETCYMLDNKSTLKIFDYIEVIVKEEV